MHESPGVEFLGELGLVLAAAFVGGYAARAVGLPVLTGYLLAGIAVGPHTPGFIADQAAVRTVADLGVALLMFAVGVQFSLEELRHVRKTAILGGGVQMAGTALLGLGLGWLFGWGVYPGLFLGCALALSSTAVLMKLLEERGELGTAHGNVMLGILVTQDLSLIGMMVLLPALAEVGTSGTGALGAVVVAVAKALLFLAATVVMATRVAPAVLERVARTGSRELLLLAAVCLCLGAGFAAERMGLGLALGAFLAGLVVSESDFAHEVFSQVRPLRDVFASLFFVSVGMLLDPGFVAAAWPEVLAVVATLLLGKPLATMVPLHLLRWHGRTTVLAGLGLAQIGEFSFVLATAGTAQGLVEARLGSVILASALVTLLLTPFVYGSADRAYQLANRWPPLSRLLNRPPGPEDQAAEQDRRDVVDARVLVLGSGRVGRYVSDALLARGISHAIVDFDPFAVDKRRERGVPVIYGDATSESVLAQLHPEKAELAVIALPEADATEMALRLLKRMAPKLPVVARVHRGRDIPRMRRAGADAVIQAEFEAGMEMVRQTLDRLGAPDPEVDAHIARVREHRYREQPPE